jgi:hypothetical protein
LSKSDAKRLTLGLFEKETIMSKKVDWRHKGEIMAIVAIRPFPRHEFTYMVAYQQLPIISLTSL